MAAIHSILSEAIDNLIESCIIQVSFKNGVQR